MVEPVACSMNCKKKPTYVCDCYDRQTFLCSNHIAAHGETNGDHHFSKIKKSPDPQTKKIIFNIFKEIKLKTIQDRLKIIQESSLLIKQITEATTESLKKIFSIEKKLDEFLYLCEKSKAINNSNSHSFIESLIKLSPKDARELKFQNDITKINKDNLKEKIENLFIVHKKKDLFNIDTFGFSRSKLIKYFNNNDLFAVDVLSQDLTQKLYTQKKIDKNPPSLLGNKSSGYYGLQKNIDKNPTCLLDNGSIFYWSQSETIIITLNNSIIPLKSPQCSNCYGLIAVNDFVYMFGGTQNTSLKFSLISNNWTQFAQYPVSDNYSISCAYFNNLILIAGRVSASVYLYNINKNTYRSVTIALNPNSGKTCLATKSKAYIIEYGRNYYESGLNDINSWTSIGNANMLRSDDCRYSYPLQYEGSYYFITSEFKLIQFDLKKKQLQLLKTL